MGKELLAARLAPDVDKHHTENYYMAVFLYHHLRYGPVLLHLER